MFGEYIKEARIEKNLSQTDLSKMTGIPQTSISEMERNVYIPKVDVFIKLSKALEIPIERLLK